VADIASLPLPAAPHLPAHDPALAQPVPGTDHAAWNLRHIAATLRGNLWLIAAIVAACTACALAVTLLQTPRYTAAATIQINDTGGRVLGDKEDEAADRPSSGLDTDRFLKTQVEVLRSRSLAQRVAQVLKLTGNPHFYAAQGEPLPEPNASAEAQRAEVIKLLQDHLLVSLPRDSRIATINVDTTDPAMSAQIANTYASEFIAANLQRKFDSSAYARTFLSGQLTEAKQRLETSERALNAYARSNGLIHAAAPVGEDKGAAAGQTVTSSSLLQLNQAANTATAHRIETESRWRAVTSGGSLGSSAVLANPAVSALMTRKAELEGLLADDRARHLDDYPSVRARQSELDAINRQLQSAANAVRSAIEGEYRGARAAEQQLAAQVARMKNDTLSEQDRMVQHGLLAREVETNRQVYDGLLERFKQLNALAGVSLSNVAIIDSAAAPERPSSPRMLRNLALGLLLGLALAGASVLIKDQFDDSIRIPEDVEAKLHLALLGVVPSASGSTPDAAMLDPKSAISEAYNSLRAALLYSTPEGMPQILLVTSAQAGEGKSTTSLALAAGFARMGKRTLLIDADLRRPSLHRRLALPNEQGLSTLLASRDGIETVQLDSGRDNLWVIGAGPIPPSPTELIATARFEDLLEEAARNFAVVVIDSPPILGLADAPAMSALVDGVVFVIESERGHRGALKASLRRLRAMRPILLGAVLTKFDPNKSGNRYSDYYGHDYGHYRHDEAAA